MRRDWRDLSCLFRHGSKTGVDSSCLMVYTAFGKVLGGKAGVLVEVDKCLNRRSKVEDIHLHISGWLNTAVRYGERNQAAYIGGT